MHIAGDTVASMTIDHDSLGDTVAGITIDHDSPGDTVAGMTTDHDSPGDTVAGITTGHDSPGDTVAGGHFLHSSGFGHGALLVRRHVSHGSFGRMMADHLCLGRELEKPLIFAKQWRVVAIDVIHPVLELHHLVDERIVARNQTFG